MRAPDDAARAKAEAGESPDEGDSSSNSSNNAGGGANRGCDVATARTALVTGVGFFADSYDIFVMCARAVMGGAVSHFPTRRNMLNVVFAAEFGAAYDDRAKSRTSSAALVGAIVGQLCFGAFADELGRKWGLVATALLLVSGSVSSAFAYWGASPASLFATLAMCRFVLGIGIGGEYPCAAARAAEAADESSCALRHRGRTVLLVFGMQGLGNLAATAVVFLLVVVSARLEAVWRIALALGAAPAACALASRLRHGESAAYVAERASRRRADGDGENDADGGGGGGADGEAPWAQWRLLARMYGLRLVGTAGAWFLWDIVYYANCLFSATIIAQLSGSSGAGGGSAEFRRASLVWTAACQLLLAVAALPGYAAAALCVDLPWLGRRRLQLLGLFVVAVIHFSIGACARARALFFANLPRFAEQEGRTGRCARGRSPLSRRIRSRSSSTSSARTRRPSSCRPRRSRRASARARTASARRAARRAPPSAPRACCR